MTPKALPPRDALFDHQKSRFRSPHVEQCVAVERGRRGLRALADTLAAVSATVVGGEPIARGPNFEHEVDALLLALIAAAREIRIEIG